MSRVATITNGSRPRTAAPIAKKTYKRSATPLDILVGKRLKGARLRVGMSQDELGHALGISFQQIQKYEKGTNRISVGRLPALATALGVDITEFYADLKPGKKDQTATEFEEFLSTKDGTDLVHAVLAIEDRKTRRMLVHIARVLAGEEMRG